MKTNDLENEIEKTLISIDKIKQAKAPKDFYKKLESRLILTSRENQKWLTLLKTGIAAMIVLSCLNGYLVLSNEEVDTPMMEDFTTEYFENNTSLIDY